MARDSLYVKVDTILSQLPNITVREFSIAAEISYRRSADIVKGRTEYLNFTSADKLCLHYGIFLPEETYTIGRTPGTIYKNYQLANCSKGHNNWYISPDGSRRECRTCKNNRKRERKNERK